MHVNRHMVRYLPIKIRQHCTVSEIARIARQSPIAMQNNAVRKIIGAFDPDRIAKIHRLHNADNIVIAVNALGCDVQIQVDFCIRVQFHSADLLVLFFFLIIPYRDTFGKGEICVRIINFAHARVKL